MNFAFKIRVVLLVITAGVAGCTCLSEPRQESLNPVSFLDRQQDNVVRLLNWNVGVNSIFPDGGRSGSFERIVRAVSPDVITLQEIDAHDRIGSLVQQAIPELDWYVHAVADNVVISRFPLLVRDGQEVVPYPLPGLGLDDFHYGHAMVLIDIPDQMSDRDLYLVAMHNKSRSGPENIAMRQQQSDAIVSAFREQRLGRRPGGPPTGTPIVIAGDLNVLQNEWPTDPLQHLTTLLTGDIIDEERFGPDVPMDWDDSALADVLPSHNGRGEVFYTWRLDQLDFLPGVLDRILYTDSVLIAENSFVLDTTTMSEDELIATGLLSSDVLFDQTPGRFDHLPMVVDFKIVGPGNAQTASK